jgi:3-methyl-2-oxobutanoate hydroxymethyltransferase
MEKTTIQTIRSFKGKKKISVLTAYDHAMALFLDKAGIDMILVGDSYGMTHLGYKDTLPVTMDEMITVTRAVAKASEHALVVADMPFLSYQTDTVTAKLNAGRFLKEADADAVKVENSYNAMDSIKAIIDMDIPVMGHIGLTPQSVKRMGGYKIQGRTSEEAFKLIRSANELADAGVFAIVLEGIPEELAAIITESVPMPTIGIGAGRHCDGQVLVINDMLGINDSYLPKHAKKYADLSGIILKAVTEYKEDIEKGIFPAESHTVHLDKGTIEKIRKDLALD